MEINKREQYYQAIKKLQVEQDIIDAMPKAEYESFFPIMYGLIDLIKKELSELQESLDNLEPELEELKEEYEEEIKTWQYKKDLCIKLLKEAKEDVEIENESKNTPIKNIIFAKTSSGNIYLEKDLKNIQE